MSNQVLRLPYNRLARVVAQREGSIRYNPDVAGKPVLNFTVVGYFGGKDEEDPVWIDVALWGDLADRFNGVVAHNQVVMIDSIIELTPDNYNDEARIKARISCNNGYQFVLMPETIKGNAAGSKEEAVAVPAKSVTSTTKNAVPF